MRPERPAVRYTAGARADSSARSTDCSPPAPPAGSVKALSRARWKYVADVETDFAPDLPPQLRLAANRITALPPRSENDRALVAELSKDDANMTRVAKIAAEDPALTVKLLQLVNSAFFGMPRKINSPLEAVILLGLKTLRAIVIACQLFEDVRRDTEDSTQLARLWGNSSRRFLSTNGGQPHERRKITSITDGR